MTKQKTLGEIAAIEAQIKSLTKERNELREKASRKRLGNVDIHSFNSAITSMVEATPTCNLGALMVKKFTLV
jgi:flagellar biosynthesis chaperone FliJ